MNVCKKTREDLSAKISELSTCAQGVYVYMTFSPLFLQTHPTFIALDFKQMSASLKPQYFLYRGSQA